MLQQLVAAHECLRQENGGRGEALQLRNLI